MAGIAKDAMLLRTMQQMRKTDPELTGPDETATEAERKAGKGTWVEAGEGPLFICSRARAPRFQVVIKPRAQQKKAIIVDMTDKFTFTNKKPNLQVVEEDEKGLFNFHFPLNAEGEEGFEKAISLMQRICNGDTGPENLPPIVSIPAADLAKIQPQQAAPATPTPTDPTVVASRAVDVGALFAQPSTKQAQAPPTMAQTQDSAFAAAQDTDPSATQGGGLGMGVGATPEPTAAGAATAAAAASQAQPANALRSTVSVPQPVPANGPHAFLPSASGPLPSPQQLAPMQGGLRPRPPPPPRPPPEAPDPPASSLMQSLFSAPKPEKPAARAGSARAAPATASPLKATAPAKAAVPAVSTPAADHAAQPTGKDSRDVGTTGAAAPASVVAAGAKPERQAGAKKAPATANAPAKPAERSVIQKEAGGIDSGAAVAARRAATRKVLDKLLQDDRFLDAVSDALDAVGLRQSPL